MRIVHLVISGDVAGGQLVALELLRASRRRGDHVAFVAPGPGPFADLVRAEGVTVHTVDVGRTFRLGGLLRLVRILREERADVLHTHTAVAANILSRLAGRLAGAAVVSHAHAHPTFRRQPLAAAAMRLADNATARLAARCIAVSESVRGAYVRQGYPAGLVVVVPNGVAVPDGEEGTGAGAGPAAPAGLRAELGIPAGAPLLGEIGRLCPQKGQPELIAAVAQVPGVHAVLVGDDLEQGGAYRDELVAQAEALGVRDRIAFVGYRPAAERLIADLDALVLPSWIEGMPLVVLEAMARGKPVIATAVGGIPEVVEEGVTGLLVPPGDPARLAAAIAELLADPERARRMGEAGLARVRERFSIEAMCRGVQEVYDGLRR